MDLFITVLGIGFYVLAVMGIFAASGLLFIAGLMPDQYLKWVNKRRARRYMPKWNRPDWAIIGALVMGILLIPIGIVAFAFPIWIQTNGGDFTLKDFAQRVLVGLSIWAIFMSFGRGFYSLLCGFMPQQMWKERNLRKIKLGLVPRTPPESWASVMVFVGMSFIFVGIMVIGFLILLAASMLRG